MSFFSELTVEINLIDEKQGNNQKIDQLSTDVGILSPKVDTLQGDVNQLHRDVQAVSSEAARANQRLDNQQTMVKYKK